MKISRLLVFLCSYSACKEEHHHMVWSFVKVYIDRETEDTSFILLDVTCSPRGLVVHVQIFAT